MNPTELPRPKWLPPHSSRWRCLKRLRKDTPVGTRVLVLEDEGRAETETTTRSPPWDCGGSGRWLVMLEDRAGGYSVGRVKVLADKAKEAT